MFMSKDHFTPRPRRLAFPTLLANLTRRDGAEFFDVAAKAGVRTQTRRYDLADANAALADLREGRLQGAAVLTP